MVVRRTWYNRFVLGIFSAMLVKTHAFVGPAGKVVGRQGNPGSSRVSMSDIPQEQPPQDENKKRLQWLRQQWLVDVLPPKPEDQMTMVGDIGSILLYVFTSHLMNDVYLSSVFFSHESALEAAKALDPAGTDIVLSAPPVWLDTTAHEVVEQVMMQNLQHQIIPHLSPILSTSGSALAALVSCWLLAGYIHRAYLFKNTISCNTENVLLVTGKVFLTATCFMTVLACLSTHLLLGDTMNTALDLDGNILSVGGLGMIPHWFGSLTRADAEYISDSFGVLMLWRFMASQVLGGSSK